MAEIVDTRIAANTNNTFPFKDSYLNSFQLAFTRYRANIFPASQKLAMPWVVPCQVRHEILYEILCSIKLEVPPEYNLKCPYSRT